ncbi:MAG: deoxyribodipyrimidine photo-lyase, partial [Planctomycetota bacterium]
SRLSPHLHFGEIGPRQIWHAVHHTFRGRPPEDAQTFLSEIGWREFAYHILYHFPTTPTKPLRADFERFHWETNAEQLRAWHRGLTGYPIVDAGMRELWTTGWMHNRVRMIVGSFLTKHLRLSWTEGARWFWDTLVDADLASNTMGWQWIGGCGADAAPYFRVFNPMMQGEKFDPQGTYVRRWVPEIAKLSDKTIHQPWSATADELRRAGVKLGQTYPLPLVDHAEARNMALAAFSQLKAPASGIRAGATDSANEKTPKR